MNKFVSSVYTLSYFLYDKANPWMTIKMTILAQQPCVSHDRFTFYDDVTVDCWWRHNGQTIMTLARENNI